MMFDSCISGEVPEHRDFIYGTAIPTLERMGVKIRVLRGPQTYVGLFTGRITRGPKKGMLRSFPICGRCAVQRDCKLKPILRYQKSLPPDTVQYIGIARDEQDRLLRLDGRRISLLDKYGYTEQDAKQLCREAGLPGSHILGMQGPFSEEWNRLSIREWNIQVLVTKDSGKRGGFEEKLSAAQKEGIRALIIGRPPEEENALDSLESVLQYLSAQPGTEESK